jgi:hypothetical protein
LRDLFGTIKTLCGLNITEGDFMAKLMPNKPSDTPRKPPHISTEDVRGGSTPHIVRYVLAFSLLLAVIAMSAVWIIPALNR